MLALVSGRDDKSEEVCKPSHERLLAQYNFQLARETGRTGDGAGRDENTDIKGNANLSILGMLGMLGDSYGRARFRSFPSSRCCRRL